MSVLYAQYPKPPSSRAINLDEEGELIDAPEQRAPKVAPLVPNLSMIQYKVLWLEVGVRASKKQPQTFPTYIEREQMHLQLSQGQLHGLSRQMQQAEVKTQEEVVDVLVLPVSLDLSGDMMDAIYVLNTRDVTHLFCAIYWCLIACGQTPS